MIIFFLSLVYAYGAQVELEHEALKNSVSPGETAEFLLKARNNRNVADSFKIVINQLDVYPFSNIIESAELDNNSSNILKLKPGEVANVNLRLKVFEDATPNVNYKTSIKIISLTNSNVADSEELVVSILAPLNLVEITTTFPDKIVAAREQEFNITLKNKVNKFLKDVEVSIVSELFQESFKTNLYYGLPFVNTIKYDLDPSTAAGKYSISIKAYYNNNLRGVFTKEFEIVRNPNIVEKSETESGFLFTVYRFEKEHKGNLILQEDVFLPLGEFARLFTDVNVPAEKTGDGYKWSFELKPGENYLVVAKTDYRIVFYGAILIIIFVLGMWYHLHKTVLIKKQLFNIKDDSGMGGIRIVLRVKNKGNPLRNVRVVDIIPGMLKPTGEYGTMKPSQIQSTYGGQRIIWDFSSLDMGDERILSYRLEVRHNINVPTTLPPAAVIYKKLNKRLTKTSNKVVFIPKKEKVK